MNFILLLNSRLFNNVSLSLNQYSKLETAKARHIDID